MILLLITTGLLFAVLGSMTAATVYISESNGAGEVVTDNITNINFVSVDASNSVAANHPVVISENSYRKYLRFKVASLGTSTTIKDLRLWKSAGVYVTGELLKIQTYQQTSAAVTYATPVATLIAGSIATIYASDPGGAIVDIAGNPAGTITVAPTYSGYFIYQTISTGSTPAGAANTKTLLFQYDET